MPRILLTGFCAVPGPNRAGVQMRHVLEALASHYSVDALVARHGEQAYVERRGTARILRVPLHDSDLPSRIEAFRRALRRQLEGAEYDVIHFRDGWSGMLVQELREHFGYRTVFDLARAPSAEAPVMDLELGNQMAHAEETCLLSADVVLTPTDTAQAHVLGKRGHNVYMVPPGVNVDTFDWDHRPSGRPVILYAGTVKPGHGIRVLLRAMAYITADFDAHLVVAGAVDDRFRRSLETAINDLGLTGRVDLRGEVEHQHIVELIATATICVAPAACESQSQPLALYPTKLLEYMACRRPVIAPRRGTTGMVMSNALHGLMFTPGDPADLARSIGILLREPDLCDRLAESGYQHVRQFHTASAVRRRLRHVYREIFASSSLSVRDDDERTGSYRTRESTDRTLMSGLHDGQDEITETNRVGSFQAPRQAPHQVPHQVPHQAPQQTRASAEIAAFNTPVESAIAVHQSWTHETDETVLPAQRAAPAQERENEEWVVPEWDEGGGWKSLSDFGADTADEIDALDENSFVAGEINVDSRRANEDRTPQFMAVSVLLGSLSDDGAGRDKP